MTAAILGGSLAHGLFEQFCKIVHVKNPHLFRHRRHAVLAGTKKMCRPLHPLGIDVVNQGGSGFLFKQIGQIAGVNEIYGEPIVVVSVSSIFLLIHAV